MAELEQDLGLRIDSALQAVAQLDRALMEVATDAGERIADELARGVQIDASPITTEITGAVEEADTDVAVGDVDAEIVTETIGEATDAADTDVTVENANAEVVTGEIEEAARAADTAIDVAEPDVSAVTDAIEEAVEAADTSGLQVLGEDARTAGGGLDSLALSTAGAAGAAENLDLATAALGGSFGGLATKAGPAGIAVAAVAGVVGVFASGAFEAQDILERFNRTFGDMAEEIEQIDVGGLNISLSELAISLGADDDALRAVATRFGDVAIAGGATRKAAAEASEQIIAIAAAASAANPALGSADQAAQGLTTALARGGRPLLAYGISLTQDEIAARALANTGKELAADLTTVEKATAGAQLAVEQFGPALAEKVAFGADQAGTKLKALKTEVGETIEGMGPPLIDPIVDLFESLTPVIVDSVEIIGQAIILLTPAIELLGDLLKALHPILETVGDVMDFVTVSSDELAESTKNLGGRVTDLKGPFGVIVDTTKQAKTEAKELAPAYDQLGASTGQAAIHLDEFGKIIRESNTIIGQASPLLDEFGNKIELTGIEAAEVTPSFDTLIAKVNEYAQTAISQLPSVSGAFEKVAEDSKVSIAELRKALAEQIVAEQEFFQNLNRIVAAGGLTLAEELSRMGPVRGGAIAKAVGESTPIVIQSIEAQVDQLKGVEFTGGRELGFQFAQGVDIGTQRLIDDIRQKVPIVQGAIEVAFNATYGEQLGRSLAESASAGYVKGITDATPAMQAATVSSLSKVSATARATFDIRSPSRVFAKIGESIGEGMALGIRSSVPAVVAAIGEFERFTVGGGNATANVQTGAPGLVAPAVSQNITVVAAQDPEATAQRVSLRVLQGAQR